MNNQIQLYTSKDGKITLQVSFEQETVWLTQAQMADLFEVKPQNITMHLQHIYAEGELMKFQLVRISYKFKKREIAKLNGKENCTT